MAIFYNAYAKTMGHEGVYSNDPNDFGGETYKGISRNYHPLWEGWVFIDSKKIYPDFINILKSIDIEPYVKIFYQEEFWDKLGLDNIIYQEVADELFDTGVNMGWEKAAKFFQKSINLLNRNETLYSDIPVDGMLGRMSLNAFNSLPKKDISILLKMLNVMQGSHYISQMKKNQEQEDYARGWFNRVEFKKV